MTVMLERPAMLERPTTIDVPDGSARFQALCRALLTMDVPDGFRAEIIGGNIVMSPWSKGYYHDIMDSIVDQLKPHAPMGHRVSYAPFLFAFPKQERGYGPDIHVASRSAFRTDKRYIDGEALSLVAELTSASTRDTDWDDKAPVYGKSGVPVYLLLDMQENAMTVFWSPSSRGYTSRLTVPFGEKVHIPAPFDCELDTSEFEAAPEQDDHSQAG
ncbi:Uma2 family endonuclease [Streptomyces gobiensis]|uniref:Uma2 family endonuclease n=1 Tax=Streptomyces gobiensis TaxID=2875706 RepID=UPI001E2F66FA|nr:Uma2 family endonuclease [Streptomyces gobiensis]UGY91354.1 Uma2 family endonuclease [Streptomyces gobiensis]